MFNVGDEVRVVKDPPRHGWGDVTREDTGIIISEEQSGIYFIDFPNHSWWKGVTADLELAIQKEPDWEV